MNKGHTFYFDYKCPITENYSTKQVDLLTQHKIFISSKSENFSVYDITKTVP